MGTLPRQGSEPRIVVWPLIEAGTFQCLLLADVDPSKTSGPVRIHPLSQPFATVAEAVAFAKGYRSMWRYVNKETDHDDD